MTQVPNMLASICFLFDIFGFFSKKTPSVMSVSWINKHFTQTTETQYAHAPSDVGLVEFTTKMAAVYRLSGQRSERHLESV